MTLAVLLFDLGEDRYAIDSGMVGALLPLPRLYRPPSLPRVLAGYADLGGRAVPVLATGVILGRSSAETDIYAHLIVIEGARAGGDFALLVDRAETLARIERRSITPVAERDSLNGCVTGEIEIDGCLVHILDVERVLLAEEGAALEELDREAASRLADWGINRDRDGASAAS
jgi:purine-binding chemotaxis protein CheW